MKTRTRFRIKKGPLVTPGCSDGSLPTSAAKRDVVLTGTLDVRDGKPAYVRIEPELSNWYILKEDTIPANKPTIIITED